MSAAFFSGSTPEHIWMAAALKTMIPLRVVGISSNVTFLLYSWFAGVMPLFVLHAALLPLNIWRLMQIRALVREVRKVAEMRSSSRFSMCQSSLVRSIAIKSAIW